MVIIGCLFTHYYLMLSDIIDCIHQLYMVIDGYEWLLNVIDGYEWLLTVINSY